MEQLKYLTELYNSQLAISTNLWNLYIIVSLGFLGFVYSSAKFKTATIAVLSIVFVAFAFSNWNLMNRTQNVLCESVKQISSLVKQEKDELKLVSSVALKLEATPPETVGKFHIGMSIAVLAGVWMPCLIKAVRRKVHPNKANPADAKKQRG